MRSDDLFTLDQMLRLAPVAPTPDTHRAALIGLILPLLDAALDTGEQDFGWHLDRLCRAISLGQAQAFFDGYGRLCGCALWTHADAAAGRLLMARGPRALAAAQLATQGAPWLLEMRSLFGSPSPLLAALNERAFADAEDVTYFRHVRGRRLVKQVTVDDRARFARGRGTPRADDKARFLATAEGQALLLETTAGIERAVERGHALCLLRKSAHVAALPLVRALQRLNVPLGLGQARLQVSPAGVPLALLTWAWLDDERLSEFQGRMPESLSRAEWNEGGRLCVCDAVATGEGRDWLAGELSGRWLPGEAIHLLPVWQGDGPGPARRWDAAERRGFDLANLGPARREVAGLLVDAA